MLSQTTTRVFVYGTLRKGEPNHHLLDATMFVRRALTAPTFTLYDLGHFPAMVADGSTSVHGELYDVDPITLRALDHLEGHPRFYHRTTITLDDGEPVMTYLLHDHQVENRPLITTGDWLAKTPKDRP